MKILSKEMLSSYKTNAVNKNGTQWLYEAINSVERESKSYEIVVFLSHKHSDKQHVKDAIVLLNDLGVNVYVDWMDSTMPKSTNCLTAEKIKKKIKNCKKFILLATEDAIASKWCNWELGFGDAEKFLKDNIAILPIKQNDKEFTGSEYLAIYPSIVEKDFYLTENHRFIVQEPNSQNYEYLYNWLKK